jgi:putative restriction endonuclease
MLNTKFHYWLSKLSELKKDRSRGTAPHKPLLHLVVLDLFETGKLSNGEFRRDGELAFRFNSCWSIGAVGRGSRPDVKLPFFHSRSDGFWTPYEEDVREAVAREVARIARLNPDYLLCLAAPEFRAAARRSILLSHFSGFSRASLAALLGIDLGIDDKYAPPPILSQSERSRKRETRFAFEVLPAYDFTCALTGYRMVAEDGTTILDAAHIHSFSKGGPCTVNNGLALSKTAHWLFDRGFWSLSDDLHVLVKKKGFYETGGLNLLLKPKDGLLLEKCPAPNNRPEPNYLAWHRAKHKF